MVFVKNSADWDALLCAMCFWYLDVILSSKVTTRWGTKLTWKSEITTNATALGSPLCRLVITALTRA